MAPEDLVTTVMRALEKANFQPLFLALSDDVVWKSAATVKGLFRFGGTYTGRDGVETWKREFEHDYTVRAIIPREIISKDDVLWSLFRVDLFYKPTWAQICFDCAMRWRLKDGKIVERQAFVDTATALIREQSGLLAR